jgi:hypothetical protein
VFLRNVNASDIHDESEFGCTVYLLCANAATVFGGAELATNVVGFGVGNVVNGISDIGVLTGLSAVQGLYLNSFTFGGSGSIAVQVLRAYDSTIEGGFICSASANLRGCVYSGDLSGTGSGTTGSFDDCEFGPGTMSAFAPSDASQVPFRNCTFSGFNIHNDDNTTAVDAVSLRNLAALNVIAQNTVTCNLQSLDSGEMAMLAPFADADQTVDFSAETRIVCFQNTLTANRTLTVLGDSGQDKQLFCVDFYGSSPGGFDLIIQDGGIPTTLAMLTNTGGCVRAWIQIQGENMALFSLEQINPTL